MQESGKKHKVDIYGDKGGVYGSKTMASNFQIFCHKTRDSLHLKLYGDFDGNSAYELINALIDHGTGLYQVFIDTNDLKRVYSFGRDVLKKNLGTLDKQLNHLIFIGENSLVNSNN